MAGTTGRIRGTFLSEVRTQVHCRDLDENNCRHRSRCFYVPLHPYRLLVIVGSRPCCGEFFTTSITLLGASVKLTSFLPAFAPQKQRIIYVLLWTKVNRLYIWERIKPEHSDGELPRALTPHSTSTALMGSIIDYHLKLNLL